MRLRVVLVLLAFALVSCSSSPPPASPGPSPSASPQDARGPSAEELLEVESVVRAYFQAIEDDDFAARKELSTGELLILADWARILNNNLPPSALTIKELEVQAVAEDEASVEFEATFEFGGAEPYTTTYTGPVELVREGSAWKIADYTRNGLRETESIFTNVKGSQEKGGLEVEVEGVILRTDSILTMIRATNRTGAPLDATYSPAPTIVSEGEQVSGGTPGPAYQVVGGASLETYFFWADQTLPLTTKGFRLVCSFVGQQSGGLIQFDIPIKLTS